MKKQVYNHPVTEVTNISLSSPILGVSSGNIDMHGGGGNAIIPD